MVPMPAQLPVVDGVVASSLDVRASVVFEYIDFSNFLQFVLELVELFVRSGKFVIELRECLTSCDSRLCRSDPNVLVS